MLAPPRGLAPPPTGNPGSAPVFEQACRDDQLKTLGGGYVQRVFQRGVGMPRCGLVCLQVVTGEPLTCDLSHVK